MIQFIIWYAFISLLGLAVFPITRRLFHRGVAQGFFFSRVIGLFLWGFGYWFLGSIKIIPVDLTGALLILAGILAGSFWVSKKSIREEYLVPLRDHKKAIITGEILFLLAFLFMVLLKSMYPNLDHTEKPMEMAFIAAILRSPTFPPRDPWLSGYAISYYYFGYVIVSLLIRISGVDAAVGFTLALSLWYGLSALVAYGIVYQLLCDWRRRIQSEQTAFHWNATRGRFYALLAPVLTLFSGNLVGLLEIFYAKGWFWKTQANGQVTSTFWQWLDIQDLTIPPTNVSQFIPNRSSWWWWQASRVLQDYDVQGTPREIIDEFPFFSFLLGDLHPHVLTIPFALTAIALCYMLFLRLKEVPVTQEGLKDAAAFLSVRSNRWFSLFSLVFIGGIAFLNTWDFPVYFGMLLLVVWLRRISVLGWNQHRFYEVIFLAMICGFVSLVLYIPFFISFASQAGGVLPSLVFFTTGKQLWIFFGGLLLPIFLWLAWLNKRHNDAMAIRNGILTVLAAWLGLGLFSLLLGLGGLSLATPTMGNNPLQLLGAKIGAAQGSNVILDILLDTLIRRLSSPFAWITLVVLLGLILSLVLTKNDIASNKTISINHETSFVLLILGIAVGLVAFPEFFYLLDNFGWRMNTIFKFYYQAWLLLSICASFGAIVILDQCKGVMKKIVWPLMGLIILMLLVYPLMGTYYRFVVDHNPAMSLDGAYHIRTYSSLEAEAIDWLKNAPDGFIVEAVGGSYRAEFGRVSTHTGLPTILGWPGHEGQWRGGYEEIGGREEAVRRIYQLRDWQETKVLLDTYQVRYIYIGSIERNTYKVDDGKFNNHLKVVFQNEAVVIYEYQGSGDIDF
jgi:YYY domain-containing protein